MFITSPLEEGYGKWWVEDHLEVIHEVVDWRTRSKLVAFLGVQLLEEAPSSYLSPRRSNIRPAAHCIEDLYRTCRTPTHVELLTLCSSMIAI